MTPDAPSLGQSMTAAQRALSIPEIVGIVISHMPRCCPGWAQDLLSCALVNKLWLDDSIKLMWKSIHQDHASIEHGFNTALERRFLDLDPNRRQHYADFVTCAMVTLIDTGRDDEDPWEKGGKLDGLTFSKMTVLHIMMIDANGNLQAGADGRDEEVLLPSLNCPNLYCMSFASGDPDVVTNFMSADVWESIFWDLPTKFPSIEYLDLGGYAHVFPNAVRRLEMRHPNLDGLEDLDVHEISRFHTKSEVEGMHSAHGTDDMDADEDEDGLNIFNEGMGEDDDVDNGEGDDPDYVD
ncbi:hypothetical protein PENANT_c007G04275 [Penicillium antarcticum]|uniref:F-box domain-containing protein n=1 Tax=Penicillium antarcticum TaxID=416450 RepID=A0A1V6QCM9_9EURO|nr:hypothetical protein PENANT_c007G04275 [Penicillium antarcticum]